MKAIILKKKILDEVHSASGLEIVNGMLYIIGDDSPFLYILNPQGEVIEKRKIFQSHSESTGRIAKKEKPDLETLTYLKYREKNYLLTLGSGSKEEMRDKGFLIEMDHFAIKELSMRTLYESFRKEVTLVGNAKLNIEGLCSTPKEIVLLLRGNVSGKNITLRYNTENFLTHLLEDEKLLEPIVSSYDLPSFEGWAAGFSGADYDLKRNSIWFTAAVEATLNEIDDGSALASFIGKISLNKDQNERLEIAPITENGQVFNGKVESLALLEESNIILAVTDSDGGDSELLWIEIVG